MPPSNWSGRKGWGDLLRETQYQCTLIQHRLTPAHPHPAQANASIPSSGTGYLSTSSEVFQLQVQSQSCRRLNISQGTICRGDEVAPPRPFPGLLERHDSVCWTCQFDAGPTAYLSRPLKEPCQLSGPSAHFLARLCPWKIAASAHLWVEATHICALGPSF